MYDTRAKDRRTAKVNGYVAEAQRARHAAALAWSPEDRALLLRLAAQAEDRAVAAARVVVVGTIDAPGSELHGLKVAL